MINLNKTALRDIATHLRHILTVEENEVILADGLKRCDQIDRIISSAGTIAGGERVLAAEEKLWEALERFLEPIDYQINVWIDTPLLPGGEFSDLGLTNEEGMRLDPNYAAAVALLPADSDTRRGFVNPAYGDGYGFVWDEPNLKLLIATLSQPESKQHAVHLGIEELRIDVLLCWHAVIGAAETVPLQELVAQLRSVRDAIGRLYAVLCIHLFPDCTYHRKPRLIDPRIPVFAILEEQQFQNLLMEFSLNDLSHNQFSGMITDFWEKTVPKLNGHPMFDGMEEEYSEYHRLLQPLRESSSWDQFLESEGAWYRNCEMILLCLTFSVRSRFADDPVMWAKHEASDRFQAAMELWDLLSKTAYDSIWSLDRGTVTHTDQWEDMALEYSRPENRELLREIGAESYFDAAYEADVLSRQIANEIFGDEDSLTLLRYYRERLVAGYNVFPLICKDDEIELE